jgi:hypothetical protein
MPDVGKSESHTSRRYDHTAQYELIMSQMGDQKFSQLEGLASSAVRATVISGAKLIVLFSSTGQTSRIVAKYRPPVRIYKSTASVSPKKCPPPSSFRVAVSYVRQAMPPGIDHAWIDDCVFTRSSCTDPFTLALLFALGVWSLWCR